MTCLPQPLFCITIQHLIDQPDNIEKLLSEYGGDVAKCIPLALKEAFHMPRIPGANETLRYLHGLWKILPELIEQKLWRGYVYKQMVKKGLTYLLPHLIAKPNYDLTLDSLFVVDRTNHFETVQYLLNFIAPDTNLMLLLLMPYMEDISTEIFELLLAKMTKPDIVQLVSELLESHLPVRESLEVQAKLVAIARKTLSPIAFVRTETNLQYYNSLPISYAKRNDISIVRLLLHPLVHDTKQ